MVFFRASYWTGTRQIEKSWVKWFGYFPYKIPSNYINLNPLLRPHVKKTTSVVCRGYFIYMAARRYKFSLRVLKIFHKCSGPSEWVKYFSAQEDKFCISKQPWNVLTIYWIYNNDIPNLFTLLIVFMLGKTRFILK